MQLVEMRENSMMPEVFKPYLDKVIETISECEEPSTMSERKKGRWYAIGNTGLAACECGYITDRYSTYKFCPNCGADMRGNTKRKGEPIEGNNESYNCENWIP